MEKSLYTIGHSTHSIETFVRLLSSHEITAVCDVRSSPYSRFNPQFNCETIEAELKKHGIAYVYLGKELGPRSEEPDCYVDGKAKYELLALTVVFQEGISRLMKGMSSYRIALMCSEKDPISCHRTILVGRRLEKDGIEIKHILEDGAIEENDDALTRLRRALKLPAADLFTSMEEMNQRAYDLQGEKIAYVEKEKGMESGMERRNYE